MQSSSEDTDSKRIKKLAKELLALERAYALLQAHVGSAVDAERDEMVITCILGAINSFMYLSFYFNEPLIFPPAWVQRHIIHIIETSLFFPKNGFL